MKISPEARDCAWRIFGKDNRKAYDDGTYDHHPTLETIQSLINSTLERAASIVDQCNREGPYNAIGAASRIRQLMENE